MSLSSARMWIALTLAACGSESSPSDGALLSESDAGELRNDAASPPGEADAGSQDRPDAGGPEPDAGPTTANPACKRGLGYGYHSQADLTALRPGVHWWYNWAAKPDTGVASSYASLQVEFVPMAWNAKSTPQGLERDIPASAKTLLGYNEPNFFFQANLSAKDAAAHWPELEAVADARGLTLASPAMNFCGPAKDCHETDPFKYLDAFFAACKDCRVDYIAAHWYACDGPALTWYLGQLKKYRRPIWLTEFSCLDGQDRSVAAQKKYMETAVAILEADADVARYAWFVGRSKDIPSIDLLGADGKLTELGELYVSLPHHDPDCAR
jgi:hypothetical protein